MQAKMAKEAKVSKSSFFISVSMIFEELEQPRSTLLTVFKENLLTVKSNSELPLEIAVQSDQFKPIVPKEFTGGSPPNRGNDGQIAFVPRPRPPNIPTNHDETQGENNFSPTFTISNLSIFSADDLVLWTEPFQGGGNDEDIRTTSPPRARSIVCTIQLTAHPADPVMPIILPLFHPTVCAADDPSSSSVGRVCPTFHPFIRSTDNPTSQPDGRQSTFPTYPVMPIIMSLIHPIVRPTDDPTILPFIYPIIHPIDYLYILSDPAIHPIIHPTDDLFIQSVGRPSQTIRLIIHPAEDPIIQSVGRPSPIQSVPSVQITIFHGSHMNRLPDLTLKSSESSTKVIPPACPNGPHFLSRKRKLPFSTSQRRRPQPASLQSSKVSIINSYGLDTLFFP